MLQGTGISGWRRGKTAAARLLTRQPMASLLRRLATGGGAVSVLVYHTLGPDGEDFDAWTVLEESTFRQQIAMLRAHYDIVSIDQALDSYGTPARKPRAVLTFDDGERGLHRHLLPLVDELGLPVTIYVATGQIERQQPYWFDAVMNALQGTRPHQIDLSRFGLAAVTIGATRGLDNWLTIARILEHLKSLPPDHRTEAAGEAVRQAPREARPHFTPMMPLRPDELAELARHPLVTIGSHTHCHSLLDQLELPAAEASVRTSVRLLRDWIGKEIKHFAYPNGNHTPPLAHALAGMGFRSAAAVGGTLWRASDSRYAIPRIPVGRYDSAERLQLRLVGI